MMDLSVPHSRPWIQVADHAAVDSILHSKMIATGSRCEAFGRAIEKQLGVPLCIPSSSGTTALIFILRTMKIGPGDEVILPTYVCTSVLNAVLSVGAIPRVCDVDEHGVITKETVAAYLTARTKAIIAVHIFGHPCDIASLTGLGIPIIEDACQAFGLRVGNSDAGTLGHFAFLSFHATKCFTTGEGGAVIVNDPAWLNDVTAAKKAYFDLNVGQFASITDIQAELGLSQLKRYSCFLHRRRKIFLRFDEAARSLRHLKVGYPGSPNFLFRFTLRTHFNFSEVQKAFETYGVQVRRGVDELLHRRLGMFDEAFPAAASLYASNVSLPFHPSLSEDEVERVLLAMNCVFDRA